MQPSELQSKHPAILPHNSQVTVARNIPTLHSQAVPTSVKLFCVSQRRQLVSLKH
jgi:hypothetical protein